MGKVTSIRLTDHEKETIKKVGNPSYVLRMIALLIDNIGARRVKKILKGE